MADQEDEELMTWATQSFGLDNRLIKACKKSGWVAPTLVQSHAIPVIMRGKDVLCRAKTGAGKTAAYLLPLLHKILSSSQTNQQGVKALILVPTNELCLQVEKQIKELTYYCAEDILCLSLATNSKGASKSSKSALMKTQAVMLQTCPDIVVATPARAQPHLTANNLTLVPSVFQTFVVDEADLVLSFGHSQDMRSIAAHLPGGGKNQSGGGCQGILMSATLSTQLQDLKKLVLHSPATIRLQDAKSNNNTNKLIQFYIALDPEDKYLLLYVFIRLGLLQGKGLIFVNDIDSAYKLRLFLAKFSIRAAALNSQLPLTSRTHMLDEFNRGVFDLLIATDEGLTANLRHESDSESSDDSSSEEEDDETDGAKQTQEHDAPSKREAKSGKRKRKAETVDPDDEYGVVRGVDFRGVSFVVNLDMPKTSEAYTHRIGRTARAGAQGTALSLISTKDASEWDLLAKIQSEQPALPAMSGQSVLAAIGPATQQEDPSATHSNAQLPQPSLLAFDLREIDGFRYRVEDVYISISKAMVREERTSELKREILRCNELQDYFAKNPNELKTLRHDTSALPSQFVPESLAHVPEYLLPNSLKVIGGDMSKAPGRKKKRKLPPGQRKKANDPLQTFVDPSAQPAGEKLYRRSDDKIKSTAGRQLWKLRHSKGAFSKKRKTQKPQQKKGRKK